MASPYTRVLFMMPFGYAMVGCHHSLPLTVLVDKHSPSAMHCPVLLEDIYPSIRHSELRDITADLLKEVCSDYTVESSQQPLTDEVLTMRTSIRGDEARCFCGSRFERAFYDIRVFNPSTPTNWSLQLTAIYRKHGQEKRQQLV